MARVLTNYHRNVAIEVSRGPKWTILVLMGSEITKDRVPNHVVEREWKTLDYPLPEAIKRFLKPSMSSTVITDSAKQELTQLQKSWKGAA